MCKLSNLRFKTQNQAITMLCSTIVLTGTFYIWGDLMLLPPHQHPPPLAYACSDHHIGVCMRQWRAQGLLPPCPPLAPLEKNKVLNLKPLGRKGWSVTQKKCSEQTMTARVEILLRHPPTLGGMFIDVVCWCTRIYPNGRSSTFVVC